MKVLFMLWNYHDERLKDYGGNTVGNGILARDLGEYIGAHEEVYFFIGQRLVSEIQIGNIHIVGTSDNLNGVNIYNLDNEERLKIMQQAFENALERIRPDIVNFHDLGDLTVRCISSCMKYRIAYVYTAHIHIRHGRPISGYDRCLLFQQKLYSVENLPIISVSTGVKKNILSDFPHIKEGNITVIPNGTAITYHNMDVSELKDRYGIVYQKVLLCVGGIFPRKNQIQIVRAFQCLPVRIQNNLKIIFCGKDAMNGLLQEEIKRNGLDDKLICTGEIKNTEMGRYYTLADGGIVASLEEAFGLSSIEAFVYGKPVIMFADLEGVPDIYDENAVVLAEERADIGLAMAIEKWYQKEWNGLIIKKYADKFSMSNVAERYLSFYKELIKMKNKG